MKPSNTYALYIALVLALGIWGVVGYAYFAIRDAHAAYARELSDVAAQSGQAAGDVKLRQFAAANRGRMQTLEALIPSDLSAITEALVAVGTAAGTTVNITDVIPIAPANKSVKEDVRVIAYTVDASGSYAAMMRTLALFDTMVLPAQMTAIDLYLDETVWRLRVRLEILTTAPISS